MMAEGKEYILAEDSVVGEVQVDDVVITKLQSGSLTEDQLERASADEDVKLVEAEAGAEAEEESEE